METDVVIIGAGGAGLMASIEAAEAGARTILLESTSRIGGSSAISGGSIVFAGTDFQKENGIHDSNRLLYYDFMTIGRYRNVPELVRTYVDHQLETYNRLKGLGVSFKTVVLGEGSVPRSHRVNPAKMILLLRKEAHRLGVETMIETRAARLIRNARGRIIGVKADRRGGESIIRARRGVVVCTGGFSNNPEMLEDFKIGFSKVRSFAAPGHRGDGLKMLIKEGARLKDMPSLKASYSTHPRSRPGKRQAVNTYRVGAILINREGRRFVNEGLGHKELPEFTVKQPGGIVFELFDAKIAQEAAARAMQIGERDLERWALIGTTLKEVAGKAGIPAKAFTETVARYNRSVGAGRDPEFGPDRPGRRIGQTRQDRHPSLLPGGRDFSHTGDVLWGTGGFPCPGPEHLWRADPGALCGRRGDGRVARRRVHVRYGLGEGPDLRTHRRKECRSGKANQKREHQGRMTAPVAADENRMPRKSGRWTSIRQVIAIG